MSVKQSDFISAVLNASQAAPEGLITPEGTPADIRFNVYRNNVAVSLTETLETIFPVLLQILGNDFFKAMAGVFLREHPPESPLLIEYGDAMPAFLESFDPVQQFPYLPDVAKLELALRQSYHAADSQPLDPAKLQAIPAEQLMESRLTIAPAVHLIRSSWPVYQLWRFNTVNNAPKPQPGAEDVLTVRPEFDPLPVLLPNGGGAFVASLIDGNTFAAALDAALKENTQYDLTETLGILFEGAAITEIQLQH